ncbi:MAG: NAD(P)-dependent oxidoreductase [Anaerolineales bacterium]|nr:MAG: NAD(P)-dependent oxidoreductase [Anaerolineales bacterium]
MAENPSPPLPEDVLEQNFSELLPPLTQAEALAEANRCLYCYDAPCTKACPTGIDVSTFIRKITTGNLKGSGRVILGSNFLGATCARVCPVDELCEGACVLRADGRKPIGIGQLQRYVTDYIMDNDLQLFQAGPPTGPKMKTKVACVGGGPASLSCAAELAKLGHAVTVFEKRELAGGLDTYGIVVFREPMSISLKEVEMVQALGVEIRTGVEVGKDVQVADLLNDYDAVFLGIGLGPVPKLGIPGEDLVGVHDGLDWVERVRLENLTEIKVGRRVVVIGAGNTAIDAAVIAARLGAEQVTIVYRRSEAEMPAYRFEYEFARQEGCEYRWLTLPVRILGEEQGPEPVEGRVTSVECVRTRLGEPGQDGRRQPEVIPDTEHVIECDQVILATGQSGYREFLDSIGLENDRGRVIVDETTGRTSHPVIFAGGDCAVTSNEMAAVVVAVEHGKRAAQGIHAMLD